MLHFVDCPNCNKRVRDNASSCHHCGAALDDSELGHPELAEGGYALSSEDDEAALNEQFERQHPLRPIWYYTAWIVFAAMLVPVILEIVTAVQVWSRA